MTLLGFLEVLPWRSGLQNLIPVLSHVHDAAERLLESVPLQRGCDFVKAILYVPLMLLCGWMLVVRMGGGRSWFAG